MSSLSHKSPFNCLGAAAFFAAIAVMATAALGGVVNHGSFPAGTASFDNVTESGSAAPPGLFAPPPPTPTSLGTLNELSFFPTSFILTDQSLNFDLKNLSSQLGMHITANPDPAADIQSISLGIAGAYQVFAPFASVPPSGTPSVAQVQMNNVPLTFTVTGVNGAPYAGGTPLAATMAVAPNDVTVVGPGGAASGNWQGTFAANMAALRAAAGILPGDRITQVQIQATAAIFAASIYGSAQASVTNFEVETVVVPEPSTMVLAGLGAVVAIGQGLRRRLARRSAGSECVSTSAVALVG